MTFREIIQMAGELRPHSLSELVLFHWLIALDGKLAAAVFLMSPEDFRQRNCAYPAGLDNEPLVTYPHQDMYVQYLIAQIDLALGENEQYQNDMAVYNESYSAFVRWFGNMYSPGKGYGKGCRCGCGPDGNPPFYITAYALAVQQGFQGTLEAWLESLHGNSVELRVAGKLMQYRIVPPAGDLGEWVTICDLSVFNADLYVQIDQLQQANAQIMERLGAPVLRITVADDGYATHTSGQIAGAAEIGVVVLVHGDTLYHYVRRAVEEGETDGPALFESIRELDGTLCVCKAEIDDDGHASFYVHAPETGGSVSIIVDSDGYLTTTDGGFDVDDDGYILM